MRTDADGRRNRAASSSLAFSLAGWIIYILGFCLDATVGAALAAATFGLAALCLVPLDFLPPVLWLVGVIQGHRALRAIRAGVEVGRGTAVAGLVVGYLGLGVIALLLVLVVVLVATGIGLAWLNRFIPFLPQGRM